MSHVIPTILLLAMHYTCFGYCLARRRKGAAALFLFCAMSLTVLLIGSVPSAYL